MTNMLRALKDKADIMQEQIGNVNGELEILRKSKRNSKDQKHYNRNEFL